MVRMFVLTAVLALSTGTLAVAQKLPPQPPPPANSMMQGDDHERKACAPDVMKFCKALVKSEQSDTFSILGCLQTNRARISAACRKVLASHGV